MLPTGTCAFAINGAGNVSNINTVPVREKVITRNGSRGQDTYGNKRGGGVVQTAPFTFCYVRKYKNAR